MSARSRRLWWLAVLGVMGLAGQAASAQIYKWVDAQGTVHFADTPPLARDSITGLETRSSEPPPPIVSGPSEVEDGVEAYDEESEVVYPAPWQQYDSGDENWLTVYSAGEPFVSTPHRHRGGHFWKRTTPHHGSGRTRVRELHVSAPQMTPETQGLNRSAPSLAGPRTVAARSRTRGRL